jgi:cation diffusion facilitator family transporter
MDIQRKASLFAVVTSAALAAAKFAAGSLSGSMAILSSGLDSLLDTAISAMNFVAIKKASEPADRGHQFGHGKIEDMAAAAQSVVIAGTGAFIIFKSVTAFMRRQSVAYMSTDVIVMSAALIFSFVIASVLRRIGQQTESMVLKADALHYTSDLYSNSGALLAMALTHVTGEGIYDFVFAVVVGIIIIVSAFRIIRGGFSALLDGSVPAEVEREIEALIAGLPYPCAGFHKLRTRLAGSRRYVDFHLLICRRLAIGEAHDLSTKVEGEIRNKIPRTDVIVHVEPCRDQCDLTEATCTVLRMRVARRR